MSTKEKQATLKAAFVFLVPLENEQPAKAGDERFVFALARARDRRREARAGTAGLFIAKGETGC